MPKFVIERQYLLPIYQRLIIEAETLEEACAEAVDPALHDWDDADEDFDGCGATTINAAREIPDGLIEQLERGEIRPAASFGKTSPDMGRASTSPNSTNELSLSLDMQQRVGVEA